MLKNISGGRREGSGRPRLPEDQRRKRYTFRISPENREYLKSLPAGERGRLINRLLDGERK